LGTLALNTERYECPKVKTKNGRLASLASHSLVTVLISELWAKWVNGWTVTLGTAQMGLDGCPLAQAYQRSNHFWEMLRWCTFPRNMLSVYCWWSVLSLCMALFISKLIFVLIGSRKSDNVEKMFFLVKVRQDSRIKTTKTKLYGSTNDNKSV